MILSILLGALSGAVSFVPLIWGLQMARKATPTGNLGQAGALLLGVFLSFIILAIATVLCVIIAKDLAVPFVLAECSGLAGFAIAYGIYKLIRK